MEIKEFDAKDSPGLDATDQIPSPQTKPDDVNKWWNSLSTEERDRCSANTRRSSAT
ncbi:hypothetical protein I553_5977 [Mycobacterium xenopi 4042]|uniref:Uncharacterized protein n=1 Tax=Mycobacterium xenopi 4042 TaxID=1299334 RepID=X8BD92_MYCXE|nr:hypothetical protein I553_5977 [Mycobacterium xenopi 4042]